MGGAGPGRRNLRVCVCEHLATEVGVHGYLSVLWALNHKRG